MRNTRSMLLWWAPAVLTGVITSIMAFAKEPVRRLTDLGVYLGGVDGLSDGASLYDFVGFHNAPFTYPPFAAVVFQPLTWFPTLAVQILWTLSTLVVIVLLAELVSRHARLNVPPAWQPRLAPIIAFGLFISAPIASNLRFGQISVLLAAMIAVDVLVLRDSRRQGVLIGLAAAIKLTPLIFIPMLWLAGRRRAAYVSAATFALCGGLAALVLPLDTWRFWTDKVRDVSRVGDLASTANQSLTGLLVRGGIDEPVRPVLALAIGGVVAALALWRAGRAGRTGDWLTALVLVGAASLVMSPVSWTHHQVWLVLAVLLPIAAARRARIAWGAGLMIVMTLPVVQLPPPLFSNLRLLLAIAIAALIPIADAPARPAEVSDEPDVADETEKIKVP